MEGSPVGTTFLRLEGFMKEIGFNLEWKRKDWLVMIGRQDDEGWYDGVDDLCKENIVS